MMPYGNGSRLSQTIIETLRDFGQMEPATLVSVIEGLEGDGAVTHDDGTILFMHVSKAGAIALADLLRRGRIVTANDPPGRAEYCGSTLPIQLGLVRLGEGEA